MLRSLYQSPRKLIRSLRRLPCSTLSTTASAAASDNSSLSFLPLFNASDELDLHASDIAASVKDWFRRSAAAKPLSPLDKVYVALSFSPKDHSLDAALAALDLRLSGDLVLRVLRHDPHPSVAASDDLLLLRLKFFDWSGRQPGYRHNRAAFHAIFTHLSTARRTSLILEWLDRFASAQSQPDPDHSLLHLVPKARFHETLVLGYSLAGRPEIALHLFGTMRVQGLELDAISYHVLLDSLVEASLFHFAEAVIAQMLSRGLTDRATACIKIKSLCLQGKLGEAEAYLREIVASSPDDVSEQAVSALVNTLCREGRFNEACRIVEEFGTARAYSIWLSNLLRARRIKAAMTFLQDKKESEGYVAEDFHYNRLISMLLEENQLEEVYDLLVEMMGEGVPPDARTMNAALCFFCKAGMVDVAIQLYNSRLELGFSPSSWLYEHLIGALCRGGSVEEACRVLEESLEQGYFPGKQTFDVLINLLCREGKLDKMRVLLADALKKEIRPTTAVFAKYISALCKAGEFEKASFVPGMIPNGSSQLARYKHTYTNLIHALIVMRRTDVLPRLLIEMQEQGHSPGRQLYREVLGCLCEMQMFYTVHELLNRQLELKLLGPQTCYNYFIDGAAHSKNLEMAREIYSRMVTAGIEPNMDTENLLLQGYLKSKRIGDALFFFDHLQEKRKPSNKLYNVFLSGLCEAGKLEQAVVLWSEAREKGLIPSLQCYESLVLLCCSSEDYDIAVNVIEDFQKTGRPVSSFLCNVLLLHSLKSEKLLRAWNKAGNGMGVVEQQGVSRGTLISGRTMLGNLIAAFSGGIRMKWNMNNLDEVIEKFFPVDIFTYNMLLRGLCMEGRMDSACHLFSRMQKKGYEPNRYSFDIIVHGYCKRGRRKDAEIWMEDMSRNGFYPTWYTIRIYNNTA